jgi:ABC-type glycerol-3-phosphate transport system substrate-binding protein
MKRVVVLSILILGLLTLSVFAATPGQLLIWADSTRAPILTQLGNEFQAVYGIPVKVVEMNFGVIRTKFVTAAAANEGPDIIVGAHRLHVRQRSRRHWRTYFRQRRGRRRWAPLLRSPTWTPPQVLRR